MVFKLPSLDNVWIVSYRPKMSNVTERSALSPIRPEGDLGEMCYKSNFRQCKFSSNSSRLQSSKQTMVKN